MSYPSGDYGFSRPNVGAVARRQLALSAIVLALVGFATLGVTYGARTPSAGPASAQIEGVNPSHAAQKPGRVVSTIRPG